MLKINRREFINRSGVTALAAVAGAYALSGCGSSSSQPGAAAKQGGNCTDNGVVSTVELLHSPNHDLFIPKEDVGLAVDKTYILGDGGSGHVHSVTVTAQDFLKLQNGQGVQIPSNSPGHIHLVTINCA